MTESELSSICGIQHAEVDVYRSVNRNEIIHVKACETSPVHKTLTNKLRNKTVMRLLSKTIFLLYKILNDNTIALIHSVVEQVNLFPAVWHPDIQIGER
jgi:hypothetical protein